MPCVHPTAQRPPPRTDIMLDRTTGQGTGRVTTPPVPGPPRPVRNASLDFWRGVVLCTIFVNHVPGNIFERFTFRNFGFSDSAEAFVFLSGVSLAIAYRDRFANGRQGASILSLGRRAVRLYGTHIALSCAGLAIFAAGAAMFPDAGLMDVHGRDLAVDDPFAASIGLVSLGHQFGYFNILPLYVVLVMMVPALLWLARYSRAAMLAGSLALYAAARLFEINVPTWPMRGTWFLDPFAWQLLMAIGLAVGLGLGESRWTAPRWLTVAALAVLGAALFCATDGFGFEAGLFDAVREHGDLDKTMLGMGRLLHFLCLALLIPLFGKAVRISASPIFGPIGVIGRHSLPNFALLSLIAAAGQVVTEGLGHSVLLDAVVIGGGLAALYGAARLLDSPARLHPSAVANARFRR